MSYWNNFQHTYMALSSLHWKIEGFNWKSKMLPKLNQNTHRRQTVSRLRGALLPLCLYILSCFLFFLRMVAWLVLCASRSIFCLNHVRITWNGVLEHGAVLQTRPTAAQLRHLLNQKLTEWVCLQIVHSFVHINTMKLNCIIQTQLAWPLSSVSCIYWRAILQIASSPASCQLPQLNLRECLCNIGHKLTHNKGGGGGGGGFQISTYYLTTSPTCSLPAQIWYCSSASDINQCHRQSVRHFFHFAAAEEWMQ